MVLLALVAAAQATCTAALPDATHDAEWAGVVKLEDPDLDCRIVRVGRASSLHIERVRGAVTQWDDSRLRFGDERLTRLGDEWVLELPEWRRGDRLRVKLRTRPVGGGVSSLVAGAISLPKPDRIHARWIRTGPVSFGENGTVDLQTTLEWTQSTDQKTVAFFAPTGALVSDCRSSSAARVNPLPHGCVFDGDQGEGALSVTYVEHGVGLSREWHLESHQTLRLEGGQVRSLREVGPDGTIAGPGPVAVHLQTVGDEEVAAVAVAEVEEAARLVSIPEPGLGIAFRGRQVDDALVRDVLSRVREQVQNGSLIAEHPLKARPLMEVRRSGWGTPWEQALLLSRYLGQMKLDARAFPVRPFARGRVTAGAPEGFTHAVVRVKVLDTEFWLDPSCGSCAAGEISPGLWGGQVFSSELDALPGEP